MVRIASLVATLSVALAFAVDAAAPAAAAAAGCQVSTFGPWSACDLTTQTRTRTRAVLPAAKGAKAATTACPPLKETESCALTAQRSASVATAAKAKANGNKTTTTTSPEQAAQCASQPPAGGLALVVIDQQVDFHPGGSLAIPAANGDAERIAAFITAHSDTISQLVFTLDSHQRYHIAHGVFWTNATGGSPAPFTAITHDDIARGVWAPRDASLQDYVLAYTSALESSNKFVLSIWPEHCVVGTPGHTIVPVVHNAALAWAAQKQARIQYVLKGTNSFTEHYSALRAEYELAFDPATSLNRALLADLARASKVAIVGEALSHCVNYSVRDLVANWPVERRKDLYVFTDCSSPVGGFEAAAAQFVADMKAAGLHIMNSTEF